MLKNYLSLTKPGIIFGNLIASAAGFFLAAKGQIDWPLLLATIFGVVFIVGSGCAFNNVIDRDIDGKMQRTKNRVLVTGLLSVNRALVFATMLGTIGFGLMYFFTSPLALAFGALGFVVYVGFYSLMFKRTSVYSTAIGSLSGACPPVMGYVAVTGTMDIAALILLMAFCLWQIPHSYAIAIYRFSDYQQAKIPILPIIKGTRSARFHMLAYIIAFVIVCVMLTQQNYASILFAIVMTTLGLYWAYVAVMEYGASNEQLWGKKLFILSVIIICSFSALISLDFVVEKPFMLAEN